MCKAMGIRELAEKVGVPPHTLRYYEEAGLMIAVSRDVAGRRIYDDSHRRWVAFLLRLREGGMGIAQIREYVDLLRSGQDQDGQERRGILRAHRDEVRAKMRRLGEHLAILDQKLAEGCTPDTPQSSRTGDDP